ncbi:MAG: hypothetical protein R6W78_14860 [Bacteroidales bacterium]
MSLEILLISIVLVAMAGIGLAIKYFSSKQAPSCKHNVNKYGRPENEACGVCGATTDEECKK